MLYNKKNFCIAGKEGACGARLLAMKHVLFGFLLLAALLLACPSILAEQEDAPGAEATALPADTPAPTSESGPAVRFGRDFSSRYAEYDDKVTLSYTVRNESVLPLTDIVVSDSLVGEVGRIDCLEPGGKKTLSVRVRVTGSCTSTPSVSYFYDGIPYEERRKAESIQLADVSLRVELDADRTNVAPGEMVTLRLRLINEGNVSLSSVRAEEPVLGDMGSVASRLDPGEECAVTRTVQMKSAATFQFEVSAGSAAGGGITVHSNEISVLVTPVASEIRLTLSAEADCTELNGPGDVSFSLYVDNECSLELRNVVLSEETRGEIRQLVFVPPGKMPAITQTYRVEESGTYRFAAQVTDAVGDRTTVYSEPIEIAVLEANGEPSASPTVSGEATEQPEATAIPVLDGAPYRMEEQPAIFDRLMAGTSLALILLLLIWHVANRFRRFSARCRRAKKRRKMRQKKNKTANRKR